MRMKIIAFLLLSQSFLFAQNIGVAAGLASSGLASWYGKKFQGRTTASGEAFNMYDYTAAHRTLPFGTIVTVTNIKNGKSVNVRINDRGPFKSNRIMDVSFQAAKALGIVSMGTTTVTITPKQTGNSVKAPIVASTELLIRTANNQDLASMMAYALKVTEPKKRVFKKNVAQPVTQAIVSNVKTNSSQNVKVQIASFATKKGAQDFILKERPKGYKMGIVSLYSQSTQQTRHKVVIFTNSNASAMMIVKSKQYNGAYILR